MLLLFAGGAAQAQSPSTIPADASSTTSIRVMGHVVRDDRTPPSLSPSLLRVFSIPSEPTESTGSGPKRVDAARAVTISPDWSFAFDVSSGRYLFRISGLPNGWMVKS